MTVISISLCKALQVTWPSICTRPLEITTEEFSKKWGTFTYEKKLKLQYTVAKPEDFMEAVKSKLNFYLIQIIGEFLL